MTGPGRDISERTSPASKPRAIRVLHIGNIANNAYLNAKILNERGFDCVVASPDYTHIMGCPEWEDGDFNGIPADQNRPDWSKLDLGGFERPQWFVGKPLAESLTILAGYKEHSPEAVASRRTDAWRRRLLSVLAELRSAGLGFLTDSLIGRRVISSGRRAFHAIANRFGTSWPRAGLIEVPAGVRPADVAAHASELGMWRTVFDGFDVVIGYGLDGQLPLLAGKRPYLAFEHGTIRAFPFEDDAVGRLCAATYREADGVFVTNCDNKIAAERLGLEHYRFVPHPVNERLPDERGVSDLRQELREELDADFLVFHPARQHWEPNVRSPNWEKGNDILIRGVAEAVAANAGPRFGLVMVRWGRTLAQTEALLDELGLSDRVKWIDPLPHLRMSEMILACDAVADQFHLGAFGSLTPKALMLGRPVLLKLDIAIHEWAFPEMPPVLNTGTPEEVAAALLEISTDAARPDEIARRSRAWYRAHHSNELIGSILEDEIRRVLKSRETAPA